ncbi:MAG: FG-GAP repeat domain-containing protein, partial [Nanobdellota archaeon]
MRRGWLLLILLVIPFVYAEDVSFDISSDSGYFFRDESDLYINFSISDEEGFVEEDRNCNVSFYNSTDNNADFSLVPDFSNGYYNYTCYECDNSYVGVECADGTIESKSIGYQEHWALSLNPSFFPMVSVENDYNITDVHYVDGEGVRHDFIDCNLSFEETDFSFSSLPFSFDYSFVESGTFNWSANCSFSDVGDVSFSGCIMDNGSCVNVSPYEPKLSLADDNPFSDLSSMNGFKLGNYDFNLDGVDDIIILGSELLIYSGDDLESYSSGSLDPVFNSSSFDSSYEFFITDFDWDGDGDILIGGNDELILLTYDGDFSFSESWSGTFNNLASFGSFDIDGDFYKDIIVLNGSHDEPWNYALIEDSDSQKITSGTLNLDNNNLEYCEEFIIFDFNKDTIQDLVCLDKTQNYIRILQRDNLSVNLSSAEFQSYELDYTPSDIFFTDIDSDGEWELGVIKKETTGFDTFYSLLFYEIKNLSKKSIEFNPNAYNIYSHYQTDLMRENKMNFITGTKTSIFETSIIYNQNEIYNTTKLNPRNSLITKNEKIISSECLENTVNCNNYVIQYTENNITDYKDDNFDYSMDIFAEKYSDNVSFSFENISSDWNYNNYFFSADFYEVNQKYRNDYFDSQQNLKYYQVHENNSYNFKVPNEDKYVVSFQPNKYSMILANATNKEKEAKGADCPYVSNLSCYVNTTGGDYNDVVFTSPNSSFVGKRVDWNNISASSNLTFINSSAGSEIINSNFSNSNITMFNLPDIKFTNCIFDNVNFDVHNSSISIDDSSVDLFLNSSTLNSSNSVVNGSKTNSTVYVYNGSSNFTEDVYYYNYSIIEFRNSLNELISLNGSYDDGSFSGNSLQKWFLVQENSSLKNYSFDFELNYEYFNESRFLPYLNSSNVFVFEETHIPSWNYSWNTSNMIDFRNYSLLSSIDNLSGNVSLNESDVVLELEVSDYNFSDLDLESYIDVINSSSFYSNFSNADFRFYGNFSKTVMIPSNNFSVDSVSVFGNVSNGSYYFVSNTNFVNDLPSENFRNINFSEFVNYSHYNG